MNKAIPLSELDVLIVDCQATGANPLNGHMIEIAWANARAAQTDQDSTAKVHSFFCKLPEEEKISRRITQITGIKNEDLESGLPLAMIWKNLIADVKRTAEINGSPLCPTVIHFSRFEEPFLRHMFEEFGSNGDHVPEQVESVPELFPFEFICTHRLATRLIPGLPRKGLRAIAGYLGYSVPEFRRAEDHILGTVHIWRHVVRLLDEQGVRTWEDLNLWLNEEAPVSKPAKRFYPMPQELRANLPDHPGVYRMLRSNGDLLYVGKATSLKKRVNSYFYQKKRNSHSEHILEMLSQAANLRVTVTGSTLEAALLETDEIKRYAPPYNVALKQKEREIVFFSPDFREYSPIPDRRHTIGPIPSKEFMASFAALFDLLKENSSAETVPTVTASLMGSEDRYVGFISLVLSASPDYAPDRECFNEGLRLFFQKHSTDIEKLKGKFGLMEFMQFGNRLYEERLDELAKAREALEESSEVIESPEAVLDVENENGDSLIAEPELWTWTPEGVCRTMEAVIRHGTHLIRRGRWFRLLSESWLTWITGKTSGKHLRRLIFSEGKIIQTENIDASSPEPANLFPPPFRVNERKTHFDIMTYDRMRVLTSEIRRLISIQPDSPKEHNRQVKLRLSDRIVLDSRQLIQLLKWV